MWPKFGQIWYLGSVQCGGSGMFIPDPGSWFLPILDPKTATKERGKKISCHTFLCSHNFHKIVNYSSFEVLKKKIWATFQRIIELFTKKIVKKLLIIWSWDRGSEIRDPEKTCSGSRIPGSKRHRIPDPDSQRCFSVANPIGINWIRVKAPCWIRMETQVFMTENYKLSPAFIYF
jgi:hypothetical protein